MSSEWKFEWLTSWDDVWSPSFITEWQSWMDKSTDAHVFFESSIVKAWAEAYSAILNIEPRFLVARSEADATIFYPLIYVRGGWKDAWQRSILAAGYSDFDYHDPVLVSGNSTKDMETFWPEFERDIFHYWAKECDVFLINGLRSVSLPNNHTYPRVGSAPWIDLSSSNSLEDLFQGSGKKLRQNIRYQTRRLQKEGNLFLRHFKLDETEAAKDTLKDFLKTRAERWPEAYNLPDFFKSIVERVLPTGFLHFSELQLNSQPISWVLGFIYKKRFYYYIPVLRADMANYSPGKVHLSMLIEKAIAAGIEVFDLLKGVEPYKMQWTNNVSNLFSLELKRHGIRSEAIQVWQKQIRPKVVKIKRKLIN
ncbi:hypothetical protein C6A37_06275, partial [Desulfobacteraceae bacterium SEEP-SAG9]